MYLHLITWQLQWVRDAMSCILSDEEVARAQRFKSFRTDWFCRRCITCSGAVLGWWCKEKCGVSMAAPRRESEWSTGVITLNAPVHPGRGSCLLWPPKKISRCRRKDDWLAASLGLLLDTVCLHETFKGVVTVDRQLCTMCMVHCGCFAVVLQLSPVTTTKISSVVWI